MLNIYVISKHQTTRDSTGRPEFFLTRCHKSSYDCDLSIRQSPDGHFYCGTHYPTDIEISRSERMETRTINTSPEYV